MTEGIWCFLVCFGYTPYEPAIKGPSDTFCHSYQRIVLSQRELDQVMRLDRKIRDRIQGNELEYLCRCTGWKTSPQGRVACGSTKQ